MKIKLLRKLLSVSLIITAFALIAVYITAKNIKMPDESLTKFKSEEFAELIQKQAIYSAGHSVQGYDAETLIKAFPGLNKGDFEGVETAEGAYVMHDSKLQFIRTENPPAGSAEKAITLKGYETLLKHLENRFPDAESAQEIVSFVSFSSKGALFKYKNDDLGIKFYHPEEYGAIIIDHFGGASGDLFTGYFENAEALKLGGISVDYSSPRAGDLTDTRGFIKKDGQYYFLYLSQSEETAYPIRPYKILNTGAGEILLLNDQSFEAERYGGSGNIIKVGAGNAAGLMNTNNETYPGIVFWNTDPSEFDNAEFEEMLSTMEFTEEFRTENPEKLTEASEVVPAEPAMPLDNVGTIFGKVKVGPICPEEDDDCVVPAETYTSRKLFAYKMKNNQVEQTYSKSINSDGTYSFVLEPGEYFMDLVRSNNLDHSAQLPYQFTVRPGSNTEYNISIDISAEAGKF